MGLEDEPDVAAHGDEFRVRKSGREIPIEHVDLAFLHGPQGANQAQQRRSLPEPDGPVMTTSLPSADASDEFS